MMQAPFCRQARGWQQRRPADGQGWLVVRRERQQAGVAPNVVWAGGNAVAGDGGFLRGAVVGHFQGRKTFLADRTREVSPAVPAFAANQFERFGHDGTSALPKRAIEKCCGAYRRRGDSLRAAE